MATESNNSGEQNTPKKPEYTSEQQAHIEELIRQKQGEAARETKVQLKQALTDLEELQKELKTSREAAAKAKSPAAKAEAQEDLENLKSQVAEARRLLEEAQEEARRFQKGLSEKEKEIMSAREETNSLRKQTILARSAEKCGFVDVNDVIVLTDRFVKWDDKKARFVVLDDNGSGERLNKSFEPMSVEEFYADYATKRPHLVRADMRSGAGSSEASKTDLGPDMPPLEELFGAKAVGWKANKFFKEAGVEAYNRAKKMAHSKGLI